MDQRNITSDLYHKLFLAALALLTVLIIGTFGFDHFGRGKYSLLDCLYMTVITISTIGYTEVVDLTHTDAGKIFNMGIMVSGIGVMTYLLSTVTAFVVEGKLSKSFHISAMENKISHLTGHYIVCGGGSIGIHLIAELALSDRPIVLVDNNPDREDELKGEFPDLLHLTGDATDNETLEKAGIMAAHGLFANTLDDNVNLMVVLTAKQLKPDLRVVAQCQTPKHVQKMKAVGAESVIVPHEIGGSRMASEMVNPRVTSFLNVMLRDSTRDLCIEEVAVPQANHGMELSEVDLRQFPNMLVLAVRHEDDDYIYNPPRNFHLEGGDRLVVMTTPEEAIKLEARLAGWERSLPIRD